jgi:predicted Rossmann-fold nucleotide-binding protein
MGGGGRGGMMEKIQKSAQDNGAHVTGITFPDLNPMVPNNEGHGNKTFGIDLILNAGKMAPRVKRMTEGSSGVLIAPGGLGTDTEALGPILMGKQPIVILNMLNPDTNERCHEKLIELLKVLGKEEGKDFHVVSPPKLESVEATAQNAARDVVQKFRDLLGREVGDQIAIK